jgi:DNA-binding beta-propeller fold protein YncE
MNRRDVLLAAVGGIAVGGIAGLWRSSRAAARPATPGPAGWAVVVTKEMLGAGMVSSGVALPSSPPVTGSRRAPVSSWGRPLPYPIVIADRRNNRLLEVTPDKRIVWEFPSPNLAIYRGNEDVNFSPDGRLLAVSEEDNYDIHLVDYDKRALAWSFGVPDVRGSAPGLLDYPDDAHVLEDGMVITADIRNCRVLIIDPRTKRIVTEWGKPRRCHHDPPRYLDHPNGVAPLDNGDILVTEMRGSWISRISRAGQVVWSVAAPGVSSPSDAFPTADGQVIVTDSIKPGRVVIFDPVSQRVTWEYEATAGDKMLDQPSLARELPGTGDIIVADDQRQRVVVIDRRTKDIVWQYGVTDQKGHAPGYLNYPDGFDIDVFRDWKGALRARP